MLDADLIAKFRQVKLLSLDLDGTLTDGGLYYAEDGSELRKYFVQDGFGIVAVMQAGIEVALITQSDTPSISRRIEKLKIRHGYMGIHDKLPKLQEICAATGIGLHEVCHVADDLNDLELMGAIGLPVAVANARPQVKKAAVYITEASGGNGAVREVCDLLLEYRI
ncbi:HAD-IIIA family hydrolase [uncultured Ferrovibrio sp.]|jgi:3-deoxy-D-manno-octulosonate 8-phosphate phosphatase (KDO 8-P phosphatase)|uniref:KdsC family phosphatase n=1 Tax=uncultured Ferrovibrio sp. TaxID=1576913 RepID=UPI00260775B8|nr:HAD-IIIA family hydrolase [uncultured Ferrovibrio sp.]